MLLRPPPMRLTASAALVVMLSCSACSSSDSADQSGSEDAATEQGPDTTGVDVATEVPAEAASIDAQEAGCSSQAELCDGKDNNCNGQIDEGDPGGGETCQTGKPGVCATGTIRCVSGATKCVQNNLPDDEVCDGQDNDCDGSADEDDPGGGAPCDTGIPGICAAGLMHCAQAQLQCVATSSGVAEECNGIDDDCSGKVDDGAIAGVGEACTVVAAQPGTPCASSKTACSGGQILCPQTWSPKPEECNGIDDDCDLAVDEPAEVNGQPCPTGLPGICSEGSATCDAGSIVCLAITNPGDQAETCNGKDDDCDGEADEGDLASVCALQNPGGVNVAAWACNAGACTVQQCAEGFLDLDALAVNGCECVMSVHPDACDAASETLVPWGTSKAAPIELSGGIPTAPGSAWFKITFARPALGVAHHFRAQLAESQAGEFSMNVRTACTGYASCSDGTDKGKGAAIWETAVSYTAGPGCCSDAPAPPEVIYVEVTRSSATPSCSTFTVSLSND